MRVFIYEHLTAASAFDEWLSSAPDGSMACEGAAMLAALSADFARLDGMTVLVLCGTAGLCGLPQGVCGIAAGSGEDARRTFQQLAAAADATLIIGPELDGVLLERCRWAEQCQAKLFSPGSDFVAWASDKHATAARLAAAGILTPAGLEIPAGQPLPDNFQWPAVLKPRCGAGSVDTQYIPSASAACRIQPAERARRLESFCPGMPASVAMLCGAAVPAILPAASQTLSSDGCFRYLGGSVPLRAGLNGRARRLATRVAGAMPPAVGYVGVDLILGDAEDGSRDFVLEINPRLTTSYVGLRELCRENLAAAMMAAACGEAVELSWRHDVVDFTADGQTGKAALAVQPPGA